MVLLSPDPSHDDIKAFMNEEERRYWDSNKGTPEERVEFWEFLEALWRSIPDPTEEQLQQVMPDHDWQHCQRGENREGILNFYRRKWKADRKAAAVARGAEEETAKARTENIPLSLEDNTVTPQEIQLPLADALDPVRDTSPSQDQNSTSSTRKALESFWRPIDAINQAARGNSRSPHLTEEDLARIDSFGTDEGSLIQGSAAPHGSEPMSEEERQEFLEKLDEERRTGNDRQPVPDNHPNSGIQALRDEVDRAGKVMGEATELLRHKTSKRLPPYEPSESKGDDDPQPSFWGRAKSWLKRNPGWVFVGGSLAMAGIGEYLVAELVLVFSFVAFAIQIHEWSSHIKKRWVAVLVKGFWLIGVALMLIFFGAVFYKLKGAKTWSNLLSKDEVTATLPSHSVPASLLPSMSPNINIPPLSKAERLDAINGIPVKGGEPQRLDRLMSAAGYRGPTFMSALIIISNKTNPIHIIVGTGGEVAASIDSGRAYHNFRFGEDTTRIFISAEKDTRIDVTYTPR